MMKNKKIIALSMLFTLLFSTIAFAGEPDPITAVANSMTISLAKNATYTGTLSVTNEDEEVLTYIIVSQPEHGDLTHSDENSPSFSYTPDTDYLGSDSFTFKVNNGEEDSNIADVSITVVEEEGGDDEPTFSARNMTLTMDKNTILTDNLEVINEDEETLTYIIVEEPENGTLVHSEEDSPEFTYTPELNYVGTDSFTFKVNNGELDSNIATVSITITEPSEPVIPFNYIDMQEHWANFSASHLAARGLIIGEEIGGNYYFHPEYKMTRSEFMIFLLAITADPEDDNIEIPSVTFADANITPDWLLDLAKLAYAKGIIKGSAEGNKIYLNPYNPISRTEAVVMIDNALNGSNSNEALTFIDKALIPEWGVQAVKNLVGYQIIQGNPGGTFNPNATITRAEAAEMSFKLVKELEKQALGEDGDDDDVK